MTDEHALLQVVYGVKMVVEMEGSKRSLVTRSWLWLW
jgi:hypothetical protein